MTAGALGAALVAAAALAAAWPAAGAGDPAPVPEQGAPIEFYYEPGCRECEEVRANILPALEAAYAGRYDLEQLDLGVASNYVRLAAHFDRLGRSENAHVFMVVGSSRMLAGYEAIEAGLFTALEETLAAPAAPPEESDARAPPPSPLSMAERARRFTPAGVVVAGLVDGINPCAISTLVFFISMLAVAKVRGRTLAVAGAVFCAASFATYFAIGFGLLRALHLFSGFTLVREAINWAMVAVLAAFSFLSFRDARRYAASGNPSDVTLQLPGGIKARIHRVMREELRGRRIAGAAFLIGVAVTVLESVCTGQVYVPTLVYVVKTGESVLRGSLYLLLYNAAFIVPLVAVFALTCFGLEFRKLMAWSVRNVVVSKILLGFFFLAMAALILVL